MKSIFIRIMLWCGDKLKMTAKFDLDDNQKIRKITFRKI